MTKSYLDEMEMFVCLSSLLRTLICSLTFLNSKSASQTFTHCCEVIMNLPHNCGHHFLLPPKDIITPTLHTLHPSLYHDNKEEDLDKTRKTGLFYHNVDRVFEDWNMAAVLCLLNFLHHRLELSSIDGHSLKIVLGALTILSKGCRNIRRFLKAEILPPLRKVEARPESGDSLKSRIVRLMTAGAHDCMDVASEFFFILCKENVDRLVKYTGFGNSAGLLMAHGLLGGGKSKGQEDYSSDSEDSDTEEYQKSKETVDPVTGGPSNPKSSPLDHMTEEEIEREAEKLASLVDQLNKQGVFKMMPVDKDNNPVSFPVKKKDSDDDNMNDVPDLD